MDTSTYKLSLAPLEQDEAEVPVLLSWSEGYARPRAGARGTLPQTPFALDELIRGSMHLVEDHHLARKSGIPTSE